MTLLVDLPLAVQNQLDQLRNTYFPKHKLKDNAHLSLLYQIHLSQEVVIQKLSQIDIPNFILQANTIKAFSNGNAINIDCPELITFQKELKKLFKFKLSKRDLIKYKPHVTVQLDVTEFKAQQTRLALEASFQPILTEALGLSLWIKDRKEQTCIWKSYKA